MLKHIIQIPIQTPKPEPKQEDNGWWGAVGNFFSGVVETIAPVVLDSLDIIPIVGNVKSGIEAVTGHNLLTGEELTEIERTASIVGIFTGGAGKVTIKTGLKVGSNLFGSTLKAAKNVTNSTSNLPTNSLFEEKPKQLLELDL